MKPVEIALKEFRDGVIKLINDSGLPPFVLELTLANVLNEVGDLARKQYDEAVKNYNAGKEKSEKT